MNRDRSLLTPAVDKDRLMRDPSIVRGPDGVFHMVWTTGWHDQGIGVAHSTDLIEWSEQKRVAFTVFRCVVARGTPGAQRKHAWLAQ